MSGRTSGLDVSFIIPVYNERENIAALHQEVAVVAKAMGLSFEIVIVDDGSDDGTPEALAKLRPATVIRLRKNYGQSSALDAGVKNARGAVLVTLDGDGQNDPHDIPALVEKLKEGYDVVCGWRHQRQDPFVKRFHSKGAAFLRKIFVDDGIHDAGCTLRAYKRECFEDLDLYGEMHRMIPALLKWRGFKVTEMKVNHRPRLHGVSKYNWIRIPKGFMDMVYVWFWRKYSLRPLHLFGGVGLAFILIGGAMAALLAVMKIFFQYALSNKIWPLMSFFLMLAGLQFVVTGLLAANIVDTSKIRKYYIESVVGNG